MNLRHQFELSLVMERLKCLRRDEMELFTAKAEALRDLEGVLLRIASDDNATGDRNEVPVAFFRATGSAVGNVGWGFCPMLTPLDVIGAGARVAVRVRTAGTTRTAAVSYTYQEKPL